MTHQDQVFELKRRSRRAGLAARASEQLVDHLIRKPVANRVEDPERVAAAGSLRSPSRTPTAPRRRYRQSIRSARRSWPS